MRYRSFRQSSTGRLLDGSMTTTDPRGFSVPGAIHAQQMAVGYGLDPADVVAEDSDTAPNLTGAIVGPTVPTPPDLLEREEARGLQLPSFAQIDTLVDTIFPGATPAQRTFYKRLARLVRRLVEQHGV